MGKGDWRATYKLSMEGDLVTDGRISFPYYLYHFEARESSLRRRMGLQQWLSKYGVFSRRRKYSRLLGAQDQEPLYIPEISITTTQRSYTHTTHGALLPSHLHLQSSIESHSSANHSHASPAFAKKSPPLKIFGLCLRLPRSPPPPTRKTTARVAVENFLAGPSQVGDEDELYQRQCRELLRRLSARGNQVPGFM